MIERRVSMGSAAGTTATVSGVIALIIGESEIARDVALYASAKGIAVVLVGARERTIGERVGEVVFGGGRARHFAGDPRAPATLAGALEKASSAFGAAAVAFVDEELAEACGPALASLAPSVRLVVLTPSSDSSIVVSKVFET